MPHVTVSELPALIASLPPLSQAEAAAFAADLTAAREELAGAAPSTEVLHAEAVYQLPRPVA